MSPVVEVRAADVAKERETLRRELRNRKMRRDAAALVDIGPQLRAAERAARADVASVGIALATVGKNARDGLRRVLEAKRRDALSYPLTPDELLNACQQAVLTARQGRTYIPETDRDDVRQTLALDVIRRHGPEPLRVKVEPNELRQRAIWIWQDLERARERATGRRATAEELADWRQHDKRAARAGALASGDSVWHLAANRTAPSAADEQSASSIAARLFDARLVTFLQADAIRLALTADRYGPMAGNERVNFHRATAILRKRFHTADAVRAVLRPETFAARLLVDAAQRQEMRRAAITSRCGSGIAGSRDSASTMPLSRFVRVSPARPLPDGGIVGPTVWPRHGHGYSGSCSLGFLYRSSGPGARRAGRLL